MQRVKEKAVPPAAPQVFGNITPAQYAILLQKANEAGLGLVGNSGTASKFGVEVAYDYSPETLQLTVQCLSAPFFMNCDTVYAKIKGLVQETIGS